MDAAYYRPSVLHCAIRRLKVPKEKVKVKDWIGLDRLPLALLIAFLPPQVPVYIVPPLPSRLLLFNLAM